MKISTKPLIERPRFAEAARRMGNMFTDNQVLGRLSSIGCVAIEITQKCNLDCTLCYLSEHSQSVKDIPIEEVYRRLDQVVTHYGKGTHVQITGGDPTLRKHSELVQIVRYASDLGLSPALFTNGIAASRSLLQRLANVGLRDVAFHVDTTQRRQEGETEKALNEIRQEYMERAHGLGLMVIFNTTVHKGNFAEIPALVRFFRERADQVGLVSFQLQADTGRGEWRSRDVIINQKTVQQQIELGSASQLPWDVIQVGHQDCHSYLPSLVINQKVYPVIRNKKLFVDFMRDFQHLSWSRQQNKKRMISQFAFAFFKQPRWWWRSVRYAMTWLGLCWKDLIKARGQTHKMTFFVQNFMDAQQLQQDRIDACSFMVMTAEGPVSMCEHNARRDDYILRPMQIRRADGTTLNYQPLKKAKQALQAISVEVKAH